MSRAAVDLRIVPLADETGEAWRDRAWARELAVQITAVHQHAGRDLGQAAR